MAQLKAQVISDGWEFKQTDTEEWLSVERVPTNVHLDLLNHKKIDDPFIGFNEIKCEWVADKEWSYRVKLPAVQHQHRGQKTVLAFDGLDTYATVQLNRQTILRSDNMFIMHRVDVTDKLSDSGDNILQIDFLPALRESRRVKDAHPEHKWVGFNADMARLAARKAQYHYGWDWGPVLITCGPWREVRLETFETRVASLLVDYRVDIKLGSVKGLIHAHIESGEHERVHFCVTSKGETVFVGDTEIGTDGRATVDFHIENAEFWYPYGYGGQSLYEVTATVVHDGIDVDSMTKRTGFRKGELIQEPDAIGKSFYFRFNDIDVFCGGSDWIPADSFTPRVTAAKYRRWLEALRDGHQVMIRVWGGGIWEEDVFYELCDELGILVWQDFMFGCGNYPAYPEILRSIEEECACQVQRLRHHPSMAIYAGNNEDYQVQEQFGLTYDYEDKNPENWLKTDFPARYIYEKLLPDVVSRFSPHIPYHPGSPWGDGKVSSDPTVGDMHQWNVWHGTQEKYQIFDTLGGRFNSEFGMEAFPHIDTIKHYVTDPAQLYPQSHMLDFHNKADGHERRIATYLVENFRTRTDLEKFIHLTQMSQAEALMFGYRGWRRQWGEQRHCGGALVWQLNDCWPVTSWAIVDYFLRKKPAFYTMRRVLAPIAIAVKRAHHDWSVVHARPALTSAFDCWVASSKVFEVRARIELRYVSIATGKDIKTAFRQDDVAIAPNGTTQILSGNIDNVSEEPHVLAARIWVNDELVARDVDWPQPLKYLDFSDRGVEVAREGDSIKVSAKKPTKGLVFEEREGVLLSDSALDVVPGDEQVVKVRHLGENDPDLKWTYVDAP